MQQNATPEYVRDLFTLIAKRYELANHLLCGGLDFWWRFITARAVAKTKPHLILDVATGSGDLAVALLKKIPTANITGVDFCAEMLAQAAKKNIPNLKLLEADGMDLPFAAASFDVVSVAFGLRNMASLEKGLDEMKRVLKPGGYLFVLDFSLPTMPIFRSCYRFYLHHILPTIAGWVTGQPDAYDYMGDSIEQFPSGEAMCSLLKRCGFSHATARPMTLGIVTLYRAEWLLP